MCVCVCMCVHVCVYACVCVPAYGVHTCMHVVNVESATHYRSHCSYLPLPSRPSLDEPPQSPEPVPGWGREEEGRGVLWREGWRRRGVWFSWRYACFISISTDFSQSDRYVISSSLHNTTKCPIMKEENYLVSGLFQFSK